MLSLKLRFSLLSSRGFGQWDQPSPQHWVTSPALPQHSPYQLLKEVFSRWNNCCLQLTTLEQFSVVTEQQDFHFASLTSANKEQWQPYLQTRIMTCSALFTSAILEPHSTVIKHRFGWPLNISQSRESRQAFASAISSPSAKARYNQIASIHLMLNSSYDPLIPSKRETTPIPLFFLRLPGRRQIYFFRIKILLLEQLDIPVLLQQISINPNLVIRLWDRLIHWKIRFVPIQAFF